MAIPGQGQANPAAAAAAAADCPCLRRLRHRQLFNILQLEGLDAALTSMAGETDACFSVRHLRRMVERGHWDAGYQYVCLFLPTRVAGLEAQVLLSFIGVQSALAHVLAGTKAGAELAFSYSMYGQRGGRGPPVSRGVLRIRSTMVTVFQLKQQLRVSMDWQRVRLKASEVVDDLAHRAQELKGLVLRPMKPCDYPIRLLGSRRCHPKKQCRRPPACVVAKHYLQRKRSLLSSSHSQGSHDVVELFEKAMNCVADLVDECLKAGKRPDFHLKHPLNPSGRAGFPPACSTTANAFAGPVIRYPGMPYADNASPFPPTCPTTASTFAGPVTYPGMPYSYNAMTNAGKFARNATTTAASSSGTVFGRLTNPDKGSVMSLMTDAGTNKHWSQEECNAESSQPAFNLQTDPRVVPTYDEEGRHPKRQRVAGTFDEANQTLVIQT